MRGGDFVFPLPLAGRVARSAGWGLLADDYGEPPPLNPCPQGGREWRAPYSAVANGDNLLPNNAELEDPTIWWAHDQYNILLNDWKGKATGIGKAGAQYFSKDGIHFQLMSHEPVFTKTVTYDDGTSETFSRRERPFIYTNEKSEALALFTACLVNEHESRVVVQPIDHYVPGN